MDALDAVMLVNDLTEHRFGMGPLGDLDANGAKLRKRAYNQAKRTYPNHPDLAALKAALDRIN